MNIRPAGALEGPKIVEPTVRPDERGWFRESFRASELEAAGIPARFVQENESSSHRGVVRGLHFQAEPFAQGKLVRCTNGRVFDVAVDVRPGSATLGKSVQVELDPGTGNALWLPPGFAHGFQALTDAATLAYLVTAEYRPDAERTVRWSDPDIGIRWPLRPGPIAARDAAAPLLRDLYPLGAAR